MSTMLDTMLRIRDLAESNGKPNDILWEIRQLIHGAIINGTLDPPASKTADFTHAGCENCGWSGLRSELISDMNRPMDEFCPECLSPYTEWITKEEAADY